MGNESSTSKNGHSNQNRLFILLLMFAAVMNFAKDINQLRALTQAAHVYASSWVQVGSDLYASHSVAQPSICPSSQKQNSDDYRWVGEIATVRGFEIPDENPKVEPVISFDSNVRRVRHNKAAALQMQDIDNFNHFAFSDEFHPLPPESGSGRVMISDDNSNPADADDSDDKKMIPLEQSRINKHMEVRSLNRTFARQAASKATSESYSFSFNMPPDLPARIERVVRQQNGTQLSARDREQLMRALHTNVRFKRVS